MENNGKKPVSRKVPTGDASAQKPVPKKRKKKRNILLGIFKFFMCLACLGIIVASVAAVGVSMYVVEATANDSELLDLNNLKLNFTSVIYAQDSTTGEYYEYQKLIGNEHRIWVESADMPDDLKNAFIAIEDKNFMEHSGFSLERTVLAGLNEVCLKLTGKYLTGAQLGASTINQQLVKKLTGDDSSSSGLDGYMRKIREIFRAIALDNNYSKEIILEAYLNRIEFTGNTAGVAAEAEKLFGKDVSELNTQECASMAAIVKAPYYYNPETYPERHIERRNQVLYEMYTQGYIETEAEYNKAVNSPLELYKKTVGEDEIVTKTSNNSYFTDMVIDEVINDFSEQYGWSKQESTSYLYNGGLSIYITMVPEVQSAMEETMFLHEMYPEEYPNGNPIIHEYEDFVYNEDGTIARDAEGKLMKQMYEETPQSAMVSVKYDGEIAGVVGGLGEKTEDRGLNRAVQSLRQTGSTMKPIGVYALGIENDYIHYSYGLIDSPIIIDDPEQKTASMSFDGVTTIPAGKKEWPRNYSKSFNNKDTMIVDALKNSLNTIAVKVGQLVEPRNSFDFLTEDLQISSLIKSEEVEVGGVTKVVTDIGLSQMALGSMTYGISPLELAGAYMIFGNGGTFTTLHSYTSVENSNGEIVLEPIITTTQAISAETSMIMNKMMEQVLISGTGSGLAMKDGMPSAGKTGTTSDDKDHWFVGLTPYYVTATWWGFDHPTDGIDFHAYGKHPPTLAWKDVMTKAQENLEKITFPVSEEVVQVTYCTESGAKAGPNCPSTARGYYKKDYTPAETCIIHPS